MKVASKKPGSAPASGKDFIAQKIAERKQKDKDAKKAGVTAGQKPVEKKEQAKAFLKSKTDKVAKKEPGKNEPKKGAAAEQIVKAKASVKDKKEAVLANARKKMGMSEEKRSEFQQRSRDSKAKRVEARQKQAAMNKEAASA